ncbi:MAG: TolC family protein [Verrucomicrobiota bacterium]
MRYRNLAPLLCVLLIFGACSTKHYRKSADKEAAAVIAQKTPAVPNMDTHFSIEVLEKLTLADLPVAEKIEEFFGAEGEAEKGAGIISMEKALEIGVKHSRTYQSRKELLYLQALELTLARHNYTPIFSGGSQATYSSTRNAVDSLTEDRSVSVRSGVGVDWLLRTGGRVAADFSTDFLRYVAGDPRAVSSSLLVGTFSQPLLRGAGYKIALENLTQAERNLLYALRDFTRFRKEFSVEIASAYYGVLQNRDAVRNSWRGFQNFKSNVEREKAFTEEGLRPQAALDQIKQAQLQTETRWINAVRSYRQSLDRYKIQLGLPVNAHVILDDLELEQLKILHPTVGVDEATKVALETRLDLYNEREQAQDATRKIKVAANSLRTKLDLVGSASVGGAGGSGFANPDFDRYGWSAGLDLDLPLDRKAQRNSYRAALITNERAARELQLAIDNIKLQINDGWRNLDQAKRNFEISEIGVELAARRVEEQELRAELGRGTARDLVDAQNDLINSKNERTTALVGHTIARLNFWRDMGILMIKDNGQWEELSNAEN